ncbi:MAG TPA: type II secretion system major pseudopilin GspG [Candidatus Limnocylindrales bacterium]|nr:type II secretion system major pseudopilin GspG [Candidatus Limnocylindrales bacterium]
MRRTASRLALRVRRGHARGRGSAQRGFTLIEILVVVMILGLLISLAAPRLIGRTDDAKVVKAKADITAIEQALNMYKLDSGYYPTSEQGLEALVEEPTRGDVPRNYKEGGYLERVPKDPWDNDFLFASDGSSYVLRSLGADGKEGGEGYEADIDSRDF